MNPTPYNLCWTLAIASVVCALATACGAQERPYTSPETDPDVADAVTPAASPLIGFWTVTRLEGRQPVNGGWPIIVAIDATAIGARSQCIPFRWTYELDETALTTTEEP